MAKDRLQLLLLLLPLLLLLLLHHRLPPPPAPPPLLQHYLLQAPRLPPSPSCNNTVVSAYYSIPSKHSHQQYLAWMTNFLTIPDCLVVFVAPEVAEEVRALRPPSLPTLLIPRPLRSSKVRALLNSR